MIEEPAAHPESGAHAPQWDVFISYSRADSSAPAASLARAFAAEGLRVFKDDLSIDPGDRWLERIDDALAGCRCFVVLIGAQGLARWVGAETTAALARHFDAPDPATRLRIVPVLTEGAEPRELPLLLAQIQTCRWNIAESAVPPPELLAAVRGTPPAQPFAAVLNRCPYVGLAPFDREDAEVFFGRERDILGAIARLGDPSPRSARDGAARARGRGHLRWLAIVGGSGMGKSSLVRAGLLPLVEAGALWPRTGLAQWTTVGPLLPGHDPLAELAKALTKACGGDSYALAQQLRTRDESALTHWLADQRLADTRGVLLVIDQFEELFTLTPAADRERFDALVAHALGDAQGALHLLSTMRSDYQHRVADELPALGRRANTLGHPYMLAPMSEPDLRRAIELPGRCAGVDVSALTPALVEDTRDDAAGALPLVQHALATLWRKRRSGAHGMLIPLEAYQDAGRLAGLLARDADALLERLRVRSAKHREGALELLLALSQYHPEGRHTRQHLPRALAVRQAGLGDTRRGEEVLAALSAQRLAAPVPEGGEPLRVDAAPEGEALRLVVVQGDGDTARVDLIHEALLRSRGTGEGRAAEPYWPTLVGHLERNKGRDLLRQTLRAAAEDWARAPWPARWFKTAGWFELRRFRALRHIATAEQQRFLRSSRLPAGLSAAALAGGAATLAWIFVLVPGYDAAYSAAWRAKDSPMWRDLVGSLTWGLGAAPPLPTAVEIPLGAFTYGCVPGRDVDEGEKCLREEASRPVDLRAMPSPCTAFGAHEVTFDEYDYYVWTQRDPPEEQRPRYPKSPGWTRGRLPVVDVNADEAEAYARWLSAYRRETWRLPTEEEWEYAARAVHPDRPGGREGRYWWGNESPAVGARANCDGCDPRHQEGSAPAGSYPANPFGLFDTVGNVWEWTASPYTENNQPSRAAGPAVPRVLRGGSWFDLPVDARASFRDWLYPGSRLGFIGFRVCRASPIGPPNADPTGR